MAAVAAHVRRALTELGLGSPVAEPERLREAWSNEVFRVRTGSGIYAVKLFTPDLTEEQVAQVRRAMDVEATVLGTGEVPMPEPVATGSGEWLVEVPGGESGAPVLFARAHRWVDGEPCSDVEPQPQIAGDVGRSLGVIHSLRLPGGDTSTCLQPVDLDRWRHAVARARQADTPWADELMESTPLVEELATRVDRLRSERRPMRASHADLDPKNAVVRPDGRVVLTDWDGAGPVLPDVELTVAAASFAGVAPELGESLVREFVSSYRAAGGDAGAPDTVALAAECGEVDWLLRNVEGCLREEPGEDDELRQRLAPALVGSFAAEVAALERWANIIADL
jgi:Ser/Thr protein kinase RdoA (MazF antagonist)